MAEQLYMQGMSYNEPDHWADQANCKGMAYELFEYQEKDSPLAAGMSYRERVEFNAANFELAAEICIECPVFFECKSNATEDDLMWTVRAGEEPVRFGEEKGTVTSKERVCQRGHYLPSGGRCPVCRLDAQRKSQPLRRAKRRAAKVDKD